MNASTGEIKEQTVFMGDFPMMTDKGTFIINGTERVVVSQLVRSPGVIYQRGRDAKTYATGTIHPYRGEWIEFDIETKPGKEPTAGARVARKRRLSLFVLLRALGYTDEAFLSAFARHFDFLETPVGQGARARPHPGGGAARDLQAGPPGRAAQRRLGPQLLRGRVLQPQALRPDPGRPLQAQPQARPGDREDRRPVPDARPRAPRAQARACCRASSCSPPAPTCCTSARTSPATGSTTRTTSPTGASAASAS